MSAAIQRHPIYDPATLSDIELEEIACRVEMTTPGNWLVVAGRDADFLYIVDALKGENSGRILRMWNGRSCRDENANFIAHAHQDIPRLVQTIRDLKEKLKAAKSAERNGL